MEVRVVIMDSKLELFLNKINLPKEEYNYFVLGHVRCKNEEEESYSGACWHDADGSSIWMSEK